MEIGQMEIGEEVEIKKPFKINTTVSDKVITIKQGDRGFIDSAGIIHLTTGNGKGKMIKVNHVEMKGYDHENISKLIFNRLNAVFWLERYLEDEEIEYKEFIEEIEDVLMDIL